MSHAIHQTPAIILKTKNMRESNKLLVLYTQKFGLIYASTQSIRELKSKMRFHTNSASLVDIDVVQGRDIWRLTGIHEEYSSFNFVGTPWYELIHKINSLILRLCNGEEAYDEIWNDLMALYPLTQESTEESKEDVESIEIIFIIRLLFHLGYWEGKESFLLIKQPFTEEFYKDIQEKKAYFVGRINEGIQSSQL